MNIFRNRYVLPGLLVVTLVLIAGCAGTAPAAQPEAQTPAPTTALETAPAVTEAPAATATSMTAESPLATPTGSATSTMAESPLATPAGTTTNSTPEATAAATVTASPAMTGTATSGGSNSAGSSAANKVTFTATEFKYDAPNTIPAGWTTFTLDNQGKQAHDLILIKPEAGKTITDVMAALSSGPPDWVGFYGGTSAAAGKRSDYTVNMPAGDYIALSFGESANGQPDAAQGMVHAFTATGDAAALSADALPEADATVNMIDFAFAISGTIGSGEQTIRVTNSGKMLHEMQVFRLNPGYTFEEFQKMLDAPPTQGQQPPFTSLGGPILSPGVDGFVTMNFEPGTHVMVCFIPSPEHNMQPHYKLGMITQFEVK